MYTNFMKFVEVNRILRSPGIYRRDIQTVKTLTKEFMEEFSTLYPDPRYLSANFHLFLHLPEAMNRYSTPSNFWLFSFERLNADIKSINTNNNSNNNIEKTYFSRFLNFTYVMELYQKIPKPIDLPDFVCDQLEKHLISPESNRTTPIKVMEPEYIEAKQAFSTLEYLSKERLDPVQEEFEDEEEDYSADMFVGLEILPANTVASIRINFDKPAFVMDYQHFAYLVDYYNATYNSSSNEQRINDRYVGGEHGAISSFDGQVIPVSNLIQKFKGVKLFTCTYRSLEGTTSKLKRGSFVLAYCRNDSTPGSPVCSLRAGQIVYFFRHTVSVRDVASGELYENQVHTFAFIRWFKNESRNFTAFSRHHMEVCKNEFEADSVMNIVPLLRIHSPIAIKINHFENVNVYIKMPRSVF